MPKTESIHIKNMVCLRCIDTVKALLDKLEIAYRYVHLGEVELVSKLDPVKASMLNQELREKGFELLEDRKSRLIGQIKNLIIQQIHHSGEPLKINFSAYLSDKLSQEYTYLSRLFSSVEGLTIEKFILKQKTERVKELITYDELSLSEIAHELGYSSVAYLSNQFKKETGMTPTAFKQVAKRQSIDLI